jgi:hypothetical protein
LKIGWVDYGRKAQCEPDPAYPDGKDILMPENDGPNRVAVCRVDLPYPATGCGLWTVECEDCGMTIGITAAGRPDDPKSVEVPCMGEQKRKDRAADRAEDKISDMLRRAAFDIQEGVGAGQMGSAAIVAKLKEILDTGIRLGAGAKPGATGDYPRGKLADGDEGGLQIAIGLHPEGKTVVMDFGKDLSWIGLDRETALTVAQTLTSHAAMIDKGKPQ